MIKAYIVESSAVIRSIEKNIIQLTSNIEIVGESGTIRDIVNLPHKFADFIFIEASPKNVVEVERLLLQRKKSIGNIILLSYEKLELLGNYSNLSVWVIPDLLSCSSEKLMEYAKIVEKEISELKTTSLFNRKKSAEKKNAEKKTAVPKKYYDRIQPVPENDYKLVLVGVSTGGPGAILKLLESIGSNFPLPILITQHIDSSFERNLTEWLQKSLPMPIHVAADNVRPVPGNVYFAPADVHMIVSKDKNGEAVIKLNNDPPVNFLKPAVDKLFISGAEVLKSKVISVLLTGMGSDGAIGSCKLREQGAYTIGESEETCVIYGMPKAAYDMGGIVELVPLYNIAKRLRQLVGREK